MGFRKRNEIITSRISSKFSSATNASQLSQDTSSFKRLHKSTYELPRGLRRSPVNGKLITSTGARDFDRIVSATHGGLVMGTSLLIEENGFSSGLNASKPDLAGYLGFSAGAGPLGNFGDALTKLFTAEGIIQGHIIHVVKIHEPQEDANSEKCDDNYTSHDSDNDTSANTIPNISIPETTPPVTPIKTSQTTSPVQHANQPKSPALACKECKRYKSIHERALNDKSWLRKIPGNITTYSTKPKDSRVHDSASPVERMRIAWRYERLTKSDSHNHHRTAHDIKDTGDKLELTSFCHDFDFTKTMDLDRPVYNSKAQVPGKPLDKRIRRDLLRATPLSLIKSCSCGRVSLNPVYGLIAALHRALSEDEKEDRKSNYATPSTLPVHRIVIGSQVLSKWILSLPVTENYDPLPNALLALMHGLRGLLRAWSERLVCMIVWPLALFPRTNALTKWLESLSDGIVELTPLNNHSSEEVHLSTNSEAKSSPHGLLRVLRYPSIHTQTSKASAVCTQEEDSTISGSTECTNDNIEANDDKDFSLPCTGPLVSKSALSMEGRGGIDEGFFPRHALPRTVFNEIDERFSLASLAATTFTDFFEFVVHARSFNITPFSLPPMDDSPTKNILNDCEPTTAKSVSHSGLSPSRETNQCTTALQHILIQLSSDRTLF